MTPRRRRSWLFVALALAVTAPLSAVVTRLVRRHRPRFPYAMSMLSAADHSALAARPQWSTASLVVAPGISLNGLIRRPRGDGAVALGDRDRARGRETWVLFFPGNDGTQLATAQKFLERLRDGRDWGLAVYAWRGIDSSSGVPMRDDLVADATQIFDSFLQREKVDPARVHVVGFSVGGYLAAHVAGQAALANKKVASLSLLASIQDVEMCRPSRFASLFAGDVYETLPLLDAVPAPALVVQGAADEALGVEQGRAIAKRLGARVRYVELPDVGHNILLETDAAITAVRGFIDPSTSN